MIRSDEDLLAVARYALETGDESLTEQYVEVQSVRLRASFLLTVNALSSTLFAQFLPVAVIFDIPLALAIATFVVCNLFCVYVMIPTGEWRITKQGGAIVRNYIESENELTAAQIFGILAIKTDEDQIKNERIVRLTHTSFFFGVVAFAFSTVFWTWHLGNQVLHSFGAST